MVENTKMERNKEEDREKLGMKKIVADCEWKKLGCYD